MPITATLLAIKPQFGIKSHQPEVLLPPPEASACSIFHKWSFPEMNAQLFSLSFHCPLHICCYSVCLTTHSCRAHSITRGTGCRTAWDFKIPFKSHSLLCIQQKMYWLSHKLHVAVPVPCFPKGILIWIQASVFSSYNATKFASEMSYPWLF